MLEDRKYRITFTEPLLGGAPLSKTVYSDYIASKSKDPDVDGPEEVEKVRDGQKGMTGFLCDDEGIYLMDYMIKGFLKETGNNLKDRLTSGEREGKKVVGIKALRKKIDENVFVFPRYIWIKDHVDGLIERPLRAETMQGPRVTLACSEYVEAGASIDIQVTLVSHKEVTWDVIETILNFGQLKGIGQWRNGSYGRFVWERIEGDDAAAARTLGPKNLLKKAV